MDNDTVKISSTIRRTRRLRVASNISQSEPGRKIAAIRISGYYIEDLGFKAGEYFDMTINDDGSLTIRPVSMEQHLQEQEMKGAVKKTNGKS